MASTHYLITDYDIQALIDNELDWEEQKRVRKAIQENPFLLRRYNEYTKQKNLIQKWFKH